MNRTQRQLLREHAKTAAERYKRPWMLAGHDEFDGFLVAQRVPRTPPGTDYPVCNVHGDDDPCQRALARMIAMLDPTSLLALLDLADAADTTAEQEQVKP